MSANPVQIDFALRGLREVDRAFETIEQRIVRLEKIVTQESDKGGRARVKAAQNEVKSREQAYQKLVKESERWQKEQTKDAERNIKERSRAEQTEAKRIDQIRERSALAAGRFAAKAAQEEVRAAQQAAREIERIELQKARTSERIAAQSSRRMSKAISGSVASGTGRVLRGAGAMAAGALAIGGGFAVADAVRSEFGAQRSAAQLVNAVTVHGPAPEGANVKNILAKAGEVSVSTGMDKQALVEGTLAYSRKAAGGDFKGAMSNMSFFAKMSKVTGSSMEEIAGAAGTLQSQNQDLSAPEMQQLLLDVNAQGKAGSMSMVDVAKQMGKLASTRGAFQGNVADNQRKLLALGQIVAPQGSPEEAGTYVSDLSEMAGKHADKLKVMGVHFKNGKMESPEQLIETMFRETKGDPTKLNKIFGQRGVKVFQGLQDSYDKAGGGEKGVLAVREKMASVTKATMSSGDMESQFAQVMATSAEKFDKAINHIKEILADKLAPFLEKFADRLPELTKTVEKVIDAAESLANLLINTPLTGISAIIIASIIKDFATAKIGEKLSGFLTSMLSGGKAGAAAASGGGGGGGPLALLGPAAATATAALLALAVGMEQLDAADRERTERQKANISGATEATNTTAGLMAKLRKGEKLTDAEMVEATAQQAKLTGQRETAGNLGFVGSLEGAIAGAVGADPRDEKDHLTATERNTIAQQKQLTDAIGEYTKIFKMQAEALKKEQVANQASPSKTDPNHPSRTVNIPTRS